MDGPALARFPLVIVVLGMAGVAMQVPAAHALRLGDWAVARSFFYHGLLVVLMAVLLGLATRDRRPRIAARYYLVSLLAIYAALPLVLALPFYRVIPGIGLWEGYFEMLSSFTTTGATLFDNPRVLGDPLHLWRALVGWLGGLMILVAAFAILEPLGLGGFEIRDRLGGAQPKGITSAEAGRRRMLKLAGTILPVYALLTGVLALLLMMAGDRPFVAICHAMAVLSTSGISPIGGIRLAPSGHLGEVFVALFLLAAVSHYTLRFQTWSRVSLRDPEIQLMLISVSVITALLFLRSFLGAVDIDRQAELGAAIRALWGSLFTVISFLTTAGFESREWATTRFWSGIQVPGILLLGVAVMGGGIATTAGGVKLLRLFALYRHGLREMDVLIHPSSVARLGPSGRQITRQGVEFAWIFLMLFLITLALVMLALSAAGAGFEVALTLGVAALTTTGPAIQILGEGASYRELSGLALGILSAAMIIGRIEMLVLIALLNPGFWRQ